MVVTINSSTEVNSSQSKLAGTTANMTCTAPLPIQWYFKQVGWNSERLIHNGYRLNNYERFANYYMTDISDAVELSSLHIWNVTNETAGTYICTGFNGIKQSMELVVLGRLSIKV